MSNRKAMITHLIVGLIKKILLYKNDFFPPYSCIKNKIKAQLDLSNYATKSDFKNATGVDTSQFAKKDDLANLKSQVDKLNIDKLSESDTHKLKPVSVDLKRLSEVVDIKIVKKDVYMLRSKILKIKYIILLT